MKRLTSRRKFPDEMLDEPDLTFSVRESEISVVSDLAFFLSLFLSLSLEREIQKNLESQTLT